MVVKLAQNQGVGGATMAGYREAIARGGQVLVKVDGDDQMDLGYIAHLVAPILLGESDDGDDAGRRCGMLPGARHRRSHQDDDAAHRDPLHLEHSGLDARVTGSAADGNREPSC